MSHCTNLNKRRFGCISRSSSSSSIDCSAKKGDRQHKSPFKNRNNGSVRVGVSIRKSNSDNKHDNYEINNNKTQKLDKNLNIAFNTLKQNLNLSLSQSHSQSLVSNLNITSNTIKSRRSSSTPPTALSMAAIPTALSRHGRCSSRYHNIAISFSFDGTRLISLNPIKNQQ